MAEECTAGWGAIASHHWLPALGFFHLERHKGTAGSLAQEKHDNPTAVIAEGLNSVAGHRWLLLEQEPPALQLSGTQPLWPKLSFARAYPPINTQEGRGCAPRLG